MSRPAPTGLPFVTSVSPDHRHFLDQYGRLILIKGDSSWPMMTDFSRSGRLWSTTRARQGFNEAITPLLGSPDNGGPREGGSIFDGLRPFMDGDVLRWNEPYREQAASHVRMAADHGITVMFCPVDG